MEDFLKLLKKSRNARHHQDLRLNTQPETNFVCKSFFCDYEIRDKVENAFSVKPEVLVDLAEAEKGSVKLTELKKNKHMITQALLEKIEANLSIIDQILNLFHIVNLNNKNLKDTSLITQQERADIIRSI